MFIAFEGQDRAGKSTLSKMLSNHFGRKYTWTKEPSFSSEEADRLNLEAKDEFDREALFLESKLRNQSFIRNNENIIIDRYVVSGIVYSKVFSPECYNFLKRVYTGPMFRRPDLHIFVNTDPQICFNRGSETPLHLLTKIRDTYVDELQSYGGNVLTLSSDDNPQEKLQLIIDEIDQLNG